MLSCAFPTDIDISVSLQVKRLDRDGLVRHFQSHGARQTYLASACDLPLPTSETAKLVYVMPKHNLAWAGERSEDMQCCMQLALATSVEEVQSACASVKTGAYCLMRHQYLRQSFTCIYVTAQKTDR